LRRSERYAASDGYSLDLRRGLGYKKKWWGWKLFQVKEHEAEGASAPAR
jgi:hypothetical protein